MVTSIKCRRNERSGNPYAYVQVPEGVDEVTIPKSWSREAQMSLPLTADSIEPVARKVSQGEDNKSDLANNALIHPYAAADREAEPDSIKIHVPTRLSKRDFEVGCRRLFQQYMPPEEGKMIRAHYRDFISRNANRSPEMRSSILGGLMKYDISDAGNLSPQFNREGDPFTDKKLRAIEKKLLGQE